VITLSRIPSCAPSLPVPFSSLILISCVSASDKPMLLQVGMPNPVTVTSGGEGYVSGTYSTPLPKEGKIPFTLSAVLAPFNFIILCEGSSKYVVDPEL